MRWIVLAASTLAAVLLWLPGQAAQPEAPALAATASEQTISFEQYREWRNHFIEQRQEQLAARLSVASLTTAQRSRIEQQKAYYDGDYILD